VTSVKQIIAVTALNFRSVPQRAATSLVIVIGLAGVVAVLLSVLSLSTGLTGALTATGRPDRAIVLHSQSQNEVGSTLARDAVLTVLDKPGIARGADGHAIASSEMIATVNLPRQDNGQLGSLTLRGVSQQLFALRPELQLVQGRVFKPGLREVIAGSAARQRYKGLEIGQQIQFGENRWTVVGVFDSGGGAHDSELLADAETVLSAYQRTTFNSVTVKLDGSDGLARLTSATTKDPTLSVMTTRETEYYEQQSQTFARFLAIVARIIAVIMAVGAIFAALNTMYSAVSTRTVEIATLRAIGFGPTAVVVSVISEALALALLGAALGALVAWSLFNGNTVSTLGGGGGLAQVVFHLRIGASLVAIGIIWACVVGLIGGLLPAIRAARQLVATALRAV
jgi:putative ABC transport system permease protein